MNSSRYILVTGATGFIGAHIVDELLRRGHRVRGTTRTAAKGELIRQARPHTADRLDFVVVGDLTHSGVFDAAAKGVDAIIHCASPVVTQSNDNEKDVIIPAIEGTKAILTAASQEPNVKRIVVTSSLTTVLDHTLGWGPGVAYTSKDWNPVTYDQAKNGDGLAAYCGAKKYAELCAWDYIRDNKPHFDLVTIIPPLVYGPIVHPVSRIADLNQSSKYIWQVVDGQDRPAIAPPVWVDVRDLAVAHVEAVLRPEAGNQRFIVTAPEKYSFQQVADILRREFDWARDVVKKGDEGAPLPDSFDADGVAAGEALGLKYRKFRESLVESVVQFKEIERRETL